MPPGPTPIFRPGMGTFGLTEAKRREPLPFLLRGPFAPAQVRGVFSIEVEIEIECGFD